MRDFKAKKQQQKWQIWNFVFFILTNPKKEVFERAKKGKKKKKLGKNLKTQKKKKANKIKVDVF